jgi:hypothetical protein
MYTVKKGEKVYIDSFAGMIKAVYLEKVSDRGYWRIRIKITSRINRVYKQGEIVSFTDTRIIPRAVCRKTGLFTYYLTDDYKFE